MRTLYVGGLPPDMNPNGLRALFEYFGELYEARLATRGHSGACRGFGYVTFIDPGSATQARTELDGEPLRDRRLRVAEAR